MVDVTVIVPTHNRRQMLPQAVHAILRQQGASFELVIVNDGSTDGTRLWIDHLAARDRRVRAVHHVQPRLISGARNAGLAVASGRWVAFCDDDDLWAPDKLAVQLAALRDGSARWSCSGVAAIDEGLRLVGHHRVGGGDVLASLLQRNVVPTGSTVVAERDLVRAVGGFDRALRGSEDWDLWIRLARHSPLAAVDRPLIAYRLGRQSLSMDVEPMRAGRRLIAERYGALAREHGVAIDEPGHERYLARQLLRAGSGWRAARIFAALAVRHGRLRELPRAVAAALAPVLTDRIGQSRAAAAIPAAWRREVEAWLAPLRREALGVGSDRPAWPKAREREA